MTKTAVVFPGQGSQSLGMLDSFSKSFIQLHETVAEASEVLAYDLGSLIHKGPIEQLNETEYTQVAMLVVDVAIYRTIQARYPFQPYLLAGHSLGEYAALVCGGALSFSDAVRLVSTRGRLMQAHVPMGSGAMAAIVGLEDAQVEQLCQEASEADNQVTPANYNSIGQIVVAGHLAAVHRVMTLADQVGARLVKIIPVSVPCHCSLLSKAAEAFLPALEQVNFQTLNCSVISNVNARPYESAESMIQQLQHQLFSPVRWVQTIQYMCQQGVEQIIECGPGQVLSGLIKRIDRSMPLKSVHDASSLEKLEE